MLNKLCESLSGLKWTVVSGLFLLLSLILMLTHQTIFLDPAWVTVAISGYPLLYLAITRLIGQKWISSCLLISMAMVASLAIGEIFAAGEVAFIMAIGAILEDLTVKRAQKGLSQLASLAPVKAHRLTDNGSTEEIPAEEIRVGDVLRVLPGETIPADGTVVSGMTCVDQSVMTGESLPVDKNPGDEVYCGTMNCFGSMDLSATGVGKDSSLQKLIRMVQEADEKKAPMQRIADQWSVWLVPIALLIAVGGFLLNWLLLDVEFMASLESGVTVLVVFCPCALALATPTSIMAAIGQATQHGVLIKSGEALEAMGRTDTIAFDKTGTLTYGQLQVCDVCPLKSNFPLLALTAAAELRSEHPLGRAIAAYAAEQQVALPEAQNFQLTPGRGISAQVEGKALLCGSEAFLKERGILLPESEEEQLEIFRDQGKAVVLTAQNGAYVGMIALSDVLRPEAPEIMNKLQDLDTRTVLLTGDHACAARHFAQKAGLTEVHADLLPQEKVGAIQALQDQGKRVCMIGDGINDAPALKTASVGVAMGSMGSDIAIEAADIALMGDDLSQLLYLKRLARSTIRTIQGNITASMVINAVAVTLSVLRVLDPVTGALVHNAGSCLVVLNAALLYDRRFD